MTKAKLKRALQTIECDVCGNVFKQMRPWQAFCCQACRRMNHARKGVNASDARAEVASLRDELNRLRAILDDAGIPY